jgi:hypothetical protein
MSATIPQIKLTLINFSINIVFITYSALNKYFICPLWWSLVNNKRCKTFQSSCINQAVLTMLSTNLSNMNTMLTQKFNLFFSVAFILLIYVKLKRKRKSDYKESCYTTGAVTGGGDTLLTLRLITWPGVLRLSLPSVRFLSIPGPYTQKTN